MELTKREQAAIDAYTQYRSQTEAAKSMNISRRTFRKFFDSAKAKLLDTPLGFKTTKISTDENGNVRAMTHKLAPEIDHKERTGKVVRTSTLYGADGSVTGEWVMRQPENKVVDDFVEALNKHFITNVKPLSVPYILYGGKTNAHDMAMFLSVDDHIGVRTTIAETGQDYGLDTAVTLMQNSFLKLLDRTPITDSCLYVNLGDQFHANDSMDVTPASKHPLFSDSSFNTVADAVVALNKWRIERLAERYDNVTIRGVAGNHDRDAMGWLFRCFKYMFTDERIDVKFWADEVGVETFGNTMLGFNHGDRMKPDALAGVCADRYPVQYGQTNMRYLHTGHYHNDKVLDTWGGFQFAGHRTMAPKDLYSYSRGYLSRQTMKSYLYNHDEGEVGKYTVSLGK
jgi:hypothetical protein